MVPNCHGSLNACISCWVCIYVVLEERGWCQSLCGGRMFAVLLGILHNSIVSLLNILSLYFMSGLEKRAT